MRFIDKLTPDQYSTLSELHKTSPKYSVRQKCHAVLLSHKRYTINSISDILSVDRDTISIWFTNWETKGLQFLEQAPRSGRPPTLNSSEKKSL